MLQDSERLKRQRQPATTTTIQTPACTSCASFRLRFPVFLARRFRPLRREKGWYRVDAAAGEGRCGDKTVRAEGSLGEEADDCKAAEASVRAERRRSELEGLTLAQEVQADDAEDEDDCEG